MKHHRAHQTLVLLSLGLSVLVSSDTTTPRTRRRLVVPPPGAARHFRAESVATVVLRAGGAGGSDVTDAGRVTRNFKAFVKKKPSKRALLVNDNSSGGTATIPSEIFNLVKGIVGVGVLSLPAGIAAFGNAPPVLAPALALIAAIGVLSGCGFATIGRVCAYTGAASYRGAWTESVGSGTSWIPAVSTTFKTFLACLAFSMVLADTFCSLLQTDARTVTLLALTVCILLPLCWMKNLSSLAPFSLVGVLGMAYTAAAMTVRYVDGSYAAPDGALREYVASEDLLPAFGDDGWRAVLKPSSLILVCMLSTAYMAHFNAPKFYRELKDNTLPRFNAVVASSFGISILLMGFITAVGFLTFGSHSAGLVLNNYAAKDLWIAASRVAVAVSLVFSYPLAFQGCRDGILDLLDNTGELRQQNKFLNLATVILLATLTLFAATLKDVSFVLAFGGATLGNALTYVYPAIMYYAVVKKQERKGESLGVVVACLSAVLGIVMGGIGAKMALEK
jgi:amino acid permease